MSKKKKYHYPWRTGNQFQVLVDGHEYFTAMLEEITSAKKQILLEIYLIESGNIANQFIDALITARKRGVSVYLLLDDYGAKELDIRDKTRLTRAGISLFLYNPVTLFRIAKSLKRDHRKLLIVDMQTAFIGGAGITDEFSPKVTSVYWHDVMLQIKGNIVNDLIDSFANVWNQSQNTQQQFSPQTLPTETKKNYPENRARILVAQGTEHNEINRALVSKIRSSKKQVWLTSPYFITSWKIRRALRHAAKKGVDVRLILPGIHSDHKWVTFAIHSYYPKLIKANIKIYEFQPRFTHSKIILCDNWFTIGSSNLDKWNQYLNLDANIEIYDSPAHAEIIKLFNNNFTDSKLVSLDEWYERTYIERFREWISGLTIRFLSFIGKKFRR